MFRKVLTMLLFVGLAGMTAMAQGEKSNPDKNRSSNGTPKTNQTITVNGVKFTMVYVAGGTFTMGCTGNQSYDKWGWEKPLHSVTLSDYYIAETEVTQALWRAVMGSDHDWTYTYGVGDNYPAYNLSYEDVLVFIHKLNKLTGRTFRMPTEAEWEYAARGGKKNSKYEYCGGNSISNVAWYEANSNDKAHIVKSKRANALGLYDMSGNLWEWCFDWFGDYEDRSQTNPDGPASGSTRCIRGGSSWDDSRLCRVSNRNGLGTNVNRNDVGFRLAMEP